MEIDEYYSQLELILLSNNASTFATIIAFGTVLVLLLCSALISGSEVAYFSLSTRVVEQLRKSSNSIDRRVAKLVDQPALLLATILIANNFINIAIIVLSSFALDAIISVDTILPSIKFLIEVVVVTFFLVLFGEVSPKIYANLKNLSLARFMSGPMVILNKIFSPLSQNFDGKYRYY